MKTTSQDQYGVGSLRISALSDPALREVAETVDIFKPVQKHNKQLSAPEMAWARDELEKLRAGETSAFSQVITDEHIADFAEGFERLERFVEDPRGRLHLIRRPTLKYAGQRFENVFELSKYANLDRMLKVMKRSGLDAIVFREESSKRVFVAIHDGGRLRRVTADTEAVLETKFYDQVTILRVLDQNNGFWEGLSQLPRALFNYLGDKFSGDSDVPAKEEPTGVQSAMEMKAWFENPAATAAVPRLASDSKRVPGLALAAMVGLGAVTYSTLIALLPKAAIVLAAIGLFGSVYNAFFGKFRKRDPYFILNLAGVQLNITDLTLELTEEERKLQADLLPPDIEEAPKSVKQFLADAEAAHSPPNEEAAQQSEMEEDADETTADS